jgi:hypothetical protein
MTTGAALFWLGSWAFVLGLTFWSFAKILRAQARRSATPDTVDDMSLRERVPPTA